LHHISPGQKYRPGIQDISGNREWVLRFRQIDDSRVIPGMIAPAACIPLALAFAAGRDGTASPPALGFSSRHSEGVSTMQHDNVAEGLADAHRNHCGCLDEEPLRAPHEQPMNA